MPITTVKAPDGSHIKVNHPEGASKEEIFAYAKASWKPEEQTAVAPREPRTAEQIQSAMIRDLLDSATEFGLETIDTLVNVGEALSPIHQISRFIGDGETMKIPALTEMARENNLLLPEGETHTGGWLGEISSALGATPYAAAGAMQIPRAASGSNLLKDMIGLGSTAMDDGMLMAAKTSQALAKNSGLDNMKLGSVELINDEDIWDAARMVAKRDIIGKNKPFMRQFERDIKKILKDVDANGTKISDVEWPEGAGPTLGRVLKELEETHKVNPKRTLQVIKRKGGLRFEEDPLTLEYGSPKLDALNQTNRVHSMGRMEQKLDEVFLPVADVLRKYVSPRVGSLYERAIETWTRRYASLMDTVGEPHKALYDLLDDRSDTIRGENARNIKRAMMDFWLDPDTNLKTARGLVRDELGDDGVKMFDDWMKKTDEFGSDIRQHVLRQDQDLDKYYVHVEKGNEYSPQWRVEGDPYSKTEAAMKVRSRDSAWDMDDLEIDQYLNPFVTHTKYLMEFDQMAQIAKRFGMRPALKVGGGEASSGVFFKEMNKTLRREGFSKPAAEAAGNLGHQIWLGTKKNMPVTARGIMNMAYSGTIGNPVSAVLNLHDIPVAAVNMGVKNTLKSLPARTKQVFGKKLAEMGISRHHSTGEFIQQFGDNLAVPNSVYEKMMKGTDKWTEVQFKASGYTLADRVGKGAVLRTAYQWMKQNAKEGNLYREMSSYATPEELRKIRPWLRDDVPMSKMPGEVRDLIEELAFVKLGEQQLISLAGRPFRYVASPWARPLYALTGFAIKQQAMLRKNVLWAMENDPKNAAKYLARYALYAGVGYGILDGEVRRTMRKQDAGEDDIFWGTVEQMGAVATFNRLGSAYDIQGFSDDPIGELASSMIPPLGYTEAMGKDLMKFIQYISSGGQTELNLADLKTLEKIPWLGQAIQYGWIDIGQETSPKESKTEQWDKVKEQWSE